MLLVLKLKICTLHKRLPVSWPLIHTHIKRKEKKRKGIQDVFYKNSNLLFIQPTVKGYGNNGWLVVSIYRDAAGDMSISALFMKGFGI